MMPVARIGDIGMGTCLCHESPRTIIGTIVTGSPTVIGGNMGKARVGDLLMCSCGHPANIIIGSPTVLADGVMQARIGDLFTGCPIGSITMGSPDIFLY